MAERKVSVEIVGDLCEDAGPVYAVYSCEVEVGVGVWVGEEGFYDVLSL